MSDFASKIAGLSPQKLALLCVELKAALDAQTQRGAEPIAVIGMGCRMPGGANDPGKFWQYLQEGRDLTGEVPSDRWDLTRWYDPDPNATERMYTSRGGFLDRVDGFDPAFFRLSPREAATLDPQQRLLLEVSWEAFQDAGIRTDQLLESRTGVFTGIGVDDYAKRQVRAGAAIDAYSGTGNAFCFASGRLSYFYGLRGPSVSLDTACSSSLVTVHLACQSLRNGECDQAIAGGVNVMLSPEASVFLSRAKALSPDGRCKTFDASADGYARSEGCGLLVLKRLSDAVQNGDRILALIRGSAVNHDGPSSGLTVPSAQAQQDVIRQALKNAGVVPGDIDYIEAHGTGTALGDPIEIRALTEVFGSRTEPMWIGSVKTNIGHLETGAGVASLIKVILSLWNEQLPPHLHFRKPNPYLSLESVPARVTASITPWPRRERPRRAGISGFGLSGTNAHVIVEEAPVAKRQDVPGEYRLQLSARTPESLNRLAESWQEWLLGDHAARHSVRDICYTAAHRLNRHEYTLTVSGDSHAALASALATHLVGDPPGQLEAIVPAEGTVVSLPAYPFDRRRCWYEQDDIRFEFEFSRSSPAWVADHVIYDAVVFPATGYLALADRAARHLHGDNPHQIRDLSIHHALLIPEEGTVRLRLTVRPDGGFEFQSESTVLVSGRIEVDTAVAPVKRVPPDVEASDSAAYYQRLRSCGFHYGPAFQGIREFRTTGTELWTRVTLPVGVPREAYALHPALLDCCMQSLGQIFGHLADAEEAWLPVAIESFRIERTGVREVWCCVDPASRPDNATFRLFTAAGRLVAELKGLKLRRTRREALTARMERHRATDDWLYKLAWIPAPRAYSLDGRLQGRWLIVADADNLAQRLAEKGAVEIRRPGDAIPANVTGLIHVGDNLASALELAKSAAGNNIRIWFVTTGADEANPQHAPIHGFARTFAQEHPDLFGGLIDLDPAVALEAQADLLANEVAHPDAERQIAFRNGQRLAARLERAVIPHSSAAIGPDGTYLITGGTRGLATPLADWLRSKGARHIVIVGRSTAPHRTDISNEQEVVTLLRRIGDTMPPLKGVFHLAGTLDDGVIAQQTWARFEQVLAPKVLGATWLDRHTRGLNLDYFVLFSAFSVNTGSPGQSSYVAANSFLDSLARNRRAQGLPALSIGWGPFAQVGMSSRLGARHAEQRAAIGVGDIPPAEGMHLLDCLLGAGVTHIGVLPVDWKRFVADGPLKSLVQAFVKQDVDTEEDSSLAGLDREPAEAAHTRLTDYLQREIARELRYPQGQLPSASHSLPELGFDSLLAMDLRNKLGRALQVDVPVRVFFESSTIFDLARRLADLRKTEEHSEAVRENALADLHSLSEAELDALLRELEQGQQA